MIEILKRQKEEAAEDQTVQAWVYVSVKFSCKNQSVRASYSSDVKYLLAFFLVDFIYYYPLVYTYANS